MLTIKIFRPVYCQTDFTKIKNFTKNSQKKNWNFLLPTTALYSEELKLYCNGSASSNFKRQAIDLQTLKSKEVIKNVLDKKRKNLTAKKDALVKDIRTKKSSVKKKKS